MWEKNNTIYPQVEETKFTKSNLISESDIEAIMSDFLPKVKELPEKINRIKNYTNLLTHSILDYTI
jgi:hypothetical protein